jgi:ubiquitin carboxyl-terminal hydrolase 34
MSTDLVAELRAEVTRWYDTVWRSAPQRRSDQEIAVSQARSDSQHLSQSSVITPILGSMLVDGPLRMITLGQELSVDIDEKTLAEVGLKDGQV